VNVATKRFKELKNLSKDELATKIRESETQLFHTRIKHSTGQLEDTATIWRLRKDLARMKMLEGQQSSNAGQSLEKVAR
jgi:large subunit ribosomal protein L29